MLENFIRLKNQLKSKILLNYEIGNLTWFRTGGKSKVFILVENVNELEIIINSLNGEEYFVMGSGSNLLIRDKGYNGVILKLGKGFNKIEIIEDTIHVGSSILDTNLSKFAKIHHIENFEFFSGIPGTVGGAIKMNAGCFGSETKDILKKINIINLHGKKNEVNSSKLSLNYRSSNLKDTDIITSAYFNLSYGQIEKIDKKLNMIKNKRENTQPIREKTSGSTFKNTSKYFAAELIDKAGCKGLEEGDAVVSLEHANFLINKGKASAKDIEILGQKVIDKVFNKFDVLLEWEIKVIGD